MNGRPDRVEGDDHEEKPSLRLRGQRTRHDARSNEKEETEELEHAAVAVAPDERPVGDIWEKFAKTLPPWKRAFDIFVSATLLVALAPLFSLIAAAIRLTSPGPIIFRQTRSGLGGRPFTLFKFRSMYIDAEQRKAELARLNEMDGPVFKIRDDPRTTPVGRRLRKWSLDELPQLYNVLTGDMTLVGPRPPLPDELRGYASWQRRRLSLTGGITCIWQVSGRNNIGFEDWMRMDMRYIRRRSAWLDARLLVQTVWSVLSSRGAS